MSACHLGGAVATGLPEADEIVAMHCRRAHRRILNAGGIEATGCGYRVFVLRLHVPSLEDFAVRRRWMLDPEMVSYNAGWQISYAGYDPISGCVDWPEEDWPAFAQRLAMPASEQGYFYVLDCEAGEFVGDVHYEVDSDGEAHIGLKDLATCAEGE